MQQIILNTWDFEFDTVRQVFNDYIKKLGSIEQLEKPFFKYSLLGYKNTLCIRLTEKTKNNSLKILIKHLKNI